MPQSTSRIGPSSLLNHTTKTVNEPYKKIQSVNYHSANSKNNAIKDLGEKIFKEIVDNEVLQDYILLLNKPQVSFTNDGIHLMLSNSCIEWQIPWDKPLEEYDTFLGLDDKVPERLRELADKFDNLIKKAQTPRP